MATPREGDIDLFAHIAVRFAVIGARPFVTIESRKDPRTAKQCEDRSMYQIAPARGADGRRIGANIMELPFDNTLPDQTGMLTQESAHGMLKFRAQGSVNEELVTTQHQSGRTGDPSSRSGRKGLCATSHTWPSGSLI